MGMIGSKRDDSDDHYIYFGSAKQMNGKIVNDVICSKDDDFAEQHFYIRYDKCKSIDRDYLYHVDKNCYMLKDLGLGSGTFLKVLTTSYSVSHSITDFSQNLRNGQIVIFGENHMLVGVTHGKNKQNEDLGKQVTSRQDMIVFKFIEGPKKGQQL